MVRFSPTGLLLLLGVQAAQAVRRTSEYELLEDAKTLQALMSRVNNVSSLMATDAGKGDKGKIDVKCDNFCFACADGTPWEIHRAQSVATKVAKGVGAAFLVAAIVTGFGPIAALIGVFGAVAAGVASGAHLLNELHKGSPFCPVVSFSKEVEDKKLKGSMTLEELNLEEIILLDTGGMVQESTRWALACNYMVLSTGKWEAHAGKMAEKLGDAAPQLKADVIKACGRWLCNNQDVSFAEDFKCGGDWWAKTKRFFR